MTMKLQQGQVWKQGKEYIRIVRLERLEVEYKSMTSLHTKEGRKLVTSKKDFCRLLKQARCWRPKKSCPRRCPDLLVSQSERLVSLAPRLQPGDS
jgi:hypothetical protein